MPETITGSLLIAISILSYGLLAIKKFMPTIITIHHPITRDRAIDMESEKWLWKKAKHMRWYSFLGMQIKVSRQELSRLVGCSREMAGRVLKDLEERGLISVSGKTIVVYGTR